MRFTILHYAIKGLLLLLALGLSGFTWAAEQTISINTANPDVTTVGVAAYGGWGLWSNGFIGFYLNSAVTSDYRLIVSAHGSPVNGVWSHMVVQVDGGMQADVNVNTAQWADYEIPITLPKGVSLLTVAFTNDAVSTTEDRNLFLQSLTIHAPDGVATPARSTQAEWAVVALAREKEAVMQTQANIEKYRKGDAVLRVTDAHGRAVPGSKVTLEQTSHDFLFGCNIYMFDRFNDPAKDAQYKQRFADLFNYATVGFYWRGYEWQQGKPNYAYTDSVVAWCLEHGIAMKGHPLLWNCTDGFPVWAKGLPTPEQQQQRVADIIGRYRGKITRWEVVNEPSHLPGLDIDQPYRWARAVDPAATLIVNDYDVLASGCPEFYRLLTQAAASGVPFDGIGIQAHEPRTMRFPLDGVRRTLDHYAALGKSLHITEFTPCSNKQPITGSPVRGEWDESAQADYAEKFYRVCFAHPAVAAITWWDLCDNGAWLPGGGMLRADLTPKPVYTALHHLIHEEWHTTVIATADRQGRARWRGFYGNYRVTVEKQDKQSTSMLHLAKGNRNDFNINWSTVDPIHTSTNPIFHSSDNYANQNSR